MRLRGLLPICMLMLASCAAPTFPTPSPQLRSAQEQARSTGAPSTLLTEPPVAGTVETTFSFPKGAAVAPLAITAGGAWIWVTVGGPVSGRLLRFGSADGKLGSATAVGWAPGFVSASADTVWVSDTLGDGSHDPTDPHENNVLAIDAKTGRIRATTKLAQPGDLVATPSAIWVITPQGIVRLDPSSGRPTATVPLGPRVPIFVSAGDGLVFVCEVDPVSSAGSLVIVDPVRAQVMRTIDVGLPIGPALIANSTVEVPVRTSADVWELRRVDVATGAMMPVGSLQSDTNVNGIEVARDGTGWAITSQRTVYSFDPTTGGLIGSPVKVAYPPSDLLSVATDPQGVWVLSSEELIKVVPPR